MNNDNPIDILKIFGLASSVEHHSLECKTAKTDLPKKIYGILILLLPIQKVLNQLNEMI